MIGGTQMAECRCPELLEAPLRYLCRAIGLAFVLLGSETVLADTNPLVNPDQIPPLRPPKSEMFPGFWEQHGVLASVTGLVGVLILILLWRMISRPRPPMIPPPAAMARQALEPLRDRSEDAALFAEVSRVLRDYFISALKLPREEFTNIELCLRMESHPGIPQDLAAASSELLHGMEHQRFTAETNAGDSHAVQRALALIDQAERALHPEPETGPAGQPRP